MDNNNHSFLPSGTVQFDCPFFQNMMEEMDSESFHLSNEELDILRRNQIIELPQQQNDPFGLQPFPESMLQHRDNNTIPIGGGSSFDVGGPSSRSDVESMAQDQFMHGCDNSFPFGGGSVVSNVGVESRSCMRDKEPMIAQDRFMHGNNNNNLYNGRGVGNFELGSLTQGNQSQPTNGKMVPPNDERVMMELTSWPPPPHPFDCSCCQVLREIIHMNNGHRFDKLEIHGSIGVISHAIIHIKDSTTGSSTESYRMIDFCGESTDEIRTFIKRYCEDHERVGFFKLDDPFSDYYDAVCTGLYWGESIDEDDDLGPPNDDDNEPEPPEPAPEPEAEPEPEHEHEHEDEPGPSNGKSSSSKRNMAVQRPRVAKMRLSDLSDYFHITKLAAAKILEISDTSMKKICRRENLKRWPSRKLESLANKVKILKDAYDFPKPGEEENRPRIQAEILRLQQEMIDACAGIAPTGLQMYQFDE